MGFEKYLLSMRLKFLDDRSGDGVTLVVRATYCKTKKKTCSYTEIERYKIESDGTNSDGGGYGGVMAAVSDSG